MSNYRRARASARIAKLQASSSLWDQAEGYRQEADAAIREARKSARFAAEQYAVARRYGQELAWLVRHPRLWGDEDYGTPAMYEHWRRSVLRLADTMLLASFRETASSRFYRDMARRYQHRAEAEQGFLAIYSERGRAWLARTGQTDAQMRAAYGLPPREA